MNNLIIFLYPFIKLGKRLTENKIYPTKFYDNLI